MVHYLLEDGITTATLDEFTCGASVYVRPHPGAPYSGAACAERALSRVGEHHYNLIFNNCEHFATWCATGEARSEQVETVAQTAADVLLGKTTLREVGTTAVKTLATGLAAGGTAGGGGFAHSGTSANARTSTTADLGTAAAVVAAAPVAAAVVGVTAATTAVLAGLAGAGSDTVEGILGSAEDKVDDILGGAGDIAENLVNRAGDLFDGLSGLWDD